MHSLLDKMGKLWWHLKKYNGSFSKTTTKEPYVCVYTHTEHINYTYIIHTSRETQNSYNWPIRYIISPWKSQKCKIRQCLKGYDVTQERCPVSWMLLIYLLYMPFCLGAQIHCKFENWIRVSLCLLNLNSKTYHLFSPWLPINTRHQRLSWFLWINVGIGVETGHKFCFALQEL